MFNDFYVCVWSIIQIMKIMTEEFKRLIMNLADVRINIKMYRMDQNISMYLILCFRFPR